MNFDQRYGMNSLSPQSPSTITTRKRIACSQIREGMFLVRILDSWWKSPFFVHRRLLRSQDVEQLVQSGILEVEIDTSKGLDISIDSQPLSPEDAREGASAQGGREYQVSCDQEGESISHDPSFLDQKKQEQLIRLREDSISAVENVFEGVKTGQAIPVTALYNTARDFVQNALANPTVLAEIMLIEQLERFDKTLYSHVVDTAVLSILIGLQLGWDARLLEEVAVASLLHDVGYMRLPLNLIHERWGKPGLDSSLLQSHVDIGLTLIHKKSQFSQQIVQMVREHHIYQDGSGYPHLQREEPVSDSGKLLGLADYFDELLAEGNTTGSFPAAFTMRRIYQEANKGKFPLLFVEGMIRVLGVYPIGTYVQLSTGEDAVVVKQNPEASVKPHVKIIRARNGKILDVPELKNLFLEEETGNEVNIIKVINAVNPSIKLREYFS